MSQVNVVVNENASVVVADESSGIVAVSAPQTSVVTAVAPGPQGPPGPPGPPGPIASSLRELIDVDIEDVEDKSILVFNAAESKFKANGIWTTDTITDGGNF